MDIVGEGNRTIIHHKVAARVICVLNEQEARAAARVMQQQLAQNPPGYALSSHHQNTSTAGHSTGSGRGSQTSEVSPNPTSTSNTPPHSLRGPLPEPLPDWSGALDHTLGTLIPNLGRPDPGHSTLCN